MSLQAYVDRYVALKRHLGYKFVNNERILRSWAAWAMTRGDDLIVADTMLGWACDASSSAAAGKRLSVGRRFAVWLHAEDSHHEVPPKHVLGPTTRRRPAPHLLTNAEISTLMAAALSLPPKGSITPHTWHCIIGLMATTGLRRSSSLPHRSSSTSSILWSGSATTRSARATYASRRSSHSSATSSSAYRPVSTSRAKSTRFQRSAAMKRWSNR